MEKNISIIFLLFSFTIQTMKNLLKMAYKKGLISTDLTSLWNSPQKVTFAENINHIMQEISNV